MDNDDYNWFLKQDFGSYANKWLAIINKKVVDTSDDVSVLIRRVKNQHPDKEPFITKVRNKLSIL